MSVSFQRRSGEHDQLFGSVTSSDIARRAGEEGLQCRSPQDPAARAAEELGEFTVPVKLHKDVTTHVKVVIEKEAVEQ